MRILIIIVFLLIDMIAALYGLFFHLFLISTTRNDFLFFFS